MRRIGLAVVITISLLAAPLAADGQQERKVHRIGFLGPRSPSDTVRFLEAFRHGLSEHGWVEGKSITIEYRFAEGKVERLSDLAAELLRHHKVEIVVVEGAEREVERPCESPSGAEPCHREERSTWRPAGSHWQKSKDAVVCG